MGATSGLCTDHISFYNHQIPIVIFVFLSRTFGIFFVFAILVEETLAVSQLVLRNDR